MKYLRAIGAALVAALVLAILVLPSPMTRGLIFRVVAPDSFAAWHEGAEYASYLADLLLILFFGGFIFIDGFAKVVAARIAALGDRNDEAWSETLGHTEAEAEKLKALSQKLAGQGRLSAADCVEGVATMVRINLEISNPLVAWRMLVKVLNALPGKLYGALALGLVLLKTVAEMALLLPPG